MFAFLSPITPRLPVTRSSFTCRRKLSSSHVTRQSTRCCIPQATTDNSTLVSTLQCEIARIVGDERGLFGVSDADRAQLDAHIRAVEASVPDTYEPTANNAACAGGEWRLIYTTIMILGRRRVKLAIATPRKPGFVNISDITQTIIPDTNRSLNVVHFNFVTGGSGKFEIDATYNVVSDKRVEVTLNEWRLEPEKMKQVLGENVGLLLDIFNPEGWLDITYVDATLRIGRDHNGNVFVLARVAHHE